MSEVRAPDPTLTAYGADTSGLDVAVADPYAERPTAHRITDYGTAACGFAWCYTHPVFLARWVAVPCRRCFPDAPEPGTHPLDLPNAGRYLAWQVQP